MEALIALAVGLLTTLGVFLVLRARTYPVILGLMMLSYAVNLFLLGTGRVSVTTPPILTDGATAYADPLPQALILTAIVIGFGMAAFVIVLALRARIALGTDHVDGHEPREPGAAPPRPVREAAGREAAEHRARRRARHARHARDGRDARDGR
jgi:multicomponent K+:H+ antiporter subunit C